MLDFAYGGIRMHYLETYFADRRGPGVGDYPSPTQAAIAALTSGSEVIVTCGKCHGEQRVKRRDGSERCCPRCDGRGSRKMRYDVAKRLFRHGGIDKATARCLDCKGSGCAVCEGRGYVDGIGAQPKSEAHAATSADLGSDFAIEVGWALRKLSRRTQDALAAWYSPDAVSRRACGEAELASLLPLTRFGRLAYSAREKAWGEELLRMAIDEATDLKALVFEELRRSHLGAKLRGATL